MMRFYFGDQFLDIKIVINLIQFILDISCMNLIFVDDAGALKKFRWAERILQTSLIGDSCQFSFIFSRTRA